jgi:hypothetical protein
MRKIKFSFSYFNFDWLIKNETEQKYQSCLFYKEKIFFDIIDFFKSKIKKQETGLLSEKVIKSFETVTEF